MGTLKENRKERNKRKKEGDRKKKRVSGERTNKYNPQGKNLEMVMSPTESHVPMRAQGFQMASKCLVE